MLPSIPCLLTLYPFSRRSSIIWSWLRLAARCSGEFIAPPDLDRSARFCCSRIFAVTRSLFSTTNLRGMSDFGTHSFGLSPCLKSMASVCGFPRSIEYWNRLFSLIMAWFRYSGSASMMGSSQSS